MNKTIFLYIWMVIPIYLFSQQSIDQKVNELTNQNSKEEIHKLALIYDANFQIAKATELYIKLANLENNPEFIFEAGRHCLELGRFAEAQQYLEDAVVQKSIFAEKANVLLQKDWSQLSSIASSKAIYPELFFPIKEKTQQFEFTIQLGVYSDINNAQDLYKRLISLDIPAFIEPNNGLYKVLLHTTSGDWLKYQKSLSNENIDYIILQ